MTKQKFLKLISGISAAAFMWQQCALALPEDFFKDMGIEENVLRPKAAGERLPFKTRGSKSVQGETLLREAIEGVILTTDQKILEAIERLKERKEPITQRSIAKEARLNEHTVSRRKKANPAIRLAIEKARKAIEEKIEEENYRKQIEKELIFRIFFKFPQYKKLKTWLVARFGISKELASEILEENKIFISARMDNLCELWPRIPSGYKLGLLKKLVDSSIKDSSIKHGDYWRQLCFLADSYPDEIRELFIKMNEMGQLDEFKKIPKAQDLLREMRLRELIEPIREIRDGPLGATLNIEFFGLGALYHFVALLLRSLPNLIKRKRTQPSEKQSLSPVSPLSSVSKTRIFKIISGGQTGADQGALFGAREVGIEPGGTAPKEYKTEGPVDHSSLLKGFGLVESRSQDYRVRTRQNVQDADVTIIFGDPDSPGSKLTIRCAEELKKPCLVNPTVEEGRALKEKYRVFNIAGNRESKSPGIQERVRRWVIDVFGPEPVSGNGSVSQGAGSERESAPPQLPPKHEVPKGLSRNDTSLDAKDESQPDVLLQEVASLYIARKKEEKNVSHDARLLMKLAVALTGSRLMEVRFPKQVEWFLSRLRAEGIDDPGDYLKGILDDNGYLRNERREEVEEVLNRIVLSFPIELQVSIDIETCLNRYPGELNYFETVALPSIVAKRLEMGDKKLRFKVIGPSTGEEMASIYYCVKMAFRNNPGWGPMNEWDIEIHGIDISEYALKEAEDRLLRKPEALKEQPVVSARDTRRSEEMRDAIHQMPEDVRKKIFRFTHGNIVYEPHRRPFLSDADAVFANTMFFQTVGNARERLIKDILGRYAWIFTESKEIYQHCCQSGRVIKAIKEPLGSIYSYSIAPPETPPQKGHPKGANLQSAPPQLPPTPDATDMSAPKGLSPVTHLEIQPNIESFERIRDWYFSKSAPQDKDRVLGNYIFESVISMLEESKKCLDNVQQRSNADLTRYKSLFDIALQKALGLKNRINTKTTASTDIFSYDVGEVYSVVSGAYQETLKNITTIFSQQIILEEGVQASLSRLQGLYYLAVYTINFYGTLCITRDRNLLRETCQLDDVISEAVVTLQHELLLENRIAVPANIIVAENSAGQRVHFKRNEIRNALLELLKNGLESLHKKDPTLKSGKVYISAYIKGNELVIEVKDEGAGIEDVYMPHLAKTGFTIKNREIPILGGFGLGLRKADWIAKFYGGKLEIGTKPGGPTRAAIVLPLRTEPPGPIRKPEPRHPQNDVLRPIPATENTNQKLFWTQIGNEA